jgi:hypothetical protein
VANTQENKYYLKTLHDEIDLFDRKLAHLLKYDTFDTDAARAAAAQKMSNKRATLAETAKRLVAEGVEFKETDLPRSFRPKDAPVAAVVEVKTETETVVAEPGHGRASRRQASAFAGTSLDWEKSVREYMLKKAAR